MRANRNLFWVVAAWAVLVEITYVVWNLMATGRVEWVGTVAVLLTGAFGIFVAFYLGRSHHAQGGELPEDRLDATIDDGDAELGFFSPWSWWPIVLAAVAALGFLGLAVGFWITYIAAALFLVAITGWVYEYYRGVHAR